MRNELFGGPIPHCSYAFENKVNSGRRAKELLEELSQTRTVFPGTGLRMVYELPGSGTEPGKKAS